MMDEWIRLMLKYKVKGTKRIYDYEWFKVHMDIFDNSYIPFYGRELKRAVREAYDNGELTHVPRDVCAFLASMVRTWDERRREREVRRRRSREDVVFEDLRAPEKEARMYLALANAFPINTGEFSHMAIMVELDRLHGFLEKFKGVPGIRAKSHYRERMDLLRKAVWKWMREHPDEVERIKERSNVAKD